MKMLTTIYVIYQSIRNISPTLVETELCYGWEYPILELVSRNLYPRSDSFVSPEERGQVCILEFEGVERIMIVNQTLIR